MSQKIFILYDGRALAGDQDDAAVLATAHSEEDARNAGKTDWADHDVIWYEYDQCGNELVNGTPRFDLPPRLQTPRQ